MALKGLAQAAEYPEDRVALNVRWWYVWSVVPAYLSDPAYVPMLRTGLETNLPTGYSGFCLLFNEPENKEPNGMNASVSTMISRYANLVVAYPLTKFLVGGCGHDHYGLITSFRAKVIEQGLPMPYGWHTHGYVYRSVGYTVARIKSDWAKLRDRTSEPIWVTEYGVPDTNINTLPDFKLLTDWIMRQARIERFAAYTNRQSGHEDWNIGAGCNLCNWTSGALTSVGTYYSGL
jgi:hypothetical protein